MSDLEFTQHASYDVSASASSCILLPLRAFHGHPLSVPPTMLYFRHFYGSATDDLGIARKEITLPSNARKEILKAFLLTSPKTAQLIVVCSYETWGKRTLLTSTVGEERRGLP